MFIHWWWALWVASAILERVAARLYDRGDSLAQQKDAIAFSLASSVVTLAAGVLAIRLVSQITQRQRRRAARVAEAEPPPPPPPREPEPQLAAR
jgi:hypothetical protein